VERRICPIATLHDTTIVDIYAELVVRWPYEFPCTMVTVVSQECQTLKRNC